MSCFIDLQLFAKDIFNEKLLCFYYKCEPIDKDLKTDTVLWHELDKGYEVNHKFVWLDKGDLVKEGVQPKHLVKLFLEDENKFLHFITKD